jgi:hypothetical protein
MESKTILARLVAALIDIPTHPCSEIQKLKPGSDIEEGLLLPVLGAELKRLSTTRPFIVLDALDEFSSSPKKRLVTLLLNLAPTVRLFVTSRPLPSVAVSDDAYIHVPLPSSNLDDLRTHIGSGIRSLEYCEYNDPETVEELQALVQDHSSQK